jgi:iron complex outermembrane receptor protein
LSVPISGAAPWYSPDTQFLRTVKVVTTTAAAYIENVFEATDRLKLIGGLRYDHIEVERKTLQGPAAVFNKSYSPFTGRVGAVYSLHDDTNVYISYSRAAQPVSQLVSLTATQADYSLQKGAQLEAGVKASLWNQRGELTLALYDIEKKDLLTSTIIDGVRVNSQIGAQVSQGAELAVSLAPAMGWRLEGNLAYTWMAQYEDFNENLGTGIIARSGNDATNVPEIVAGLFVMRDWGIWSFNAGVRHVAERWANTNNSIEVDAYTTVDAAITLQLGNVVTTLRGRNLTDELYTSGSSALTPRLEDPRTTELSMRYAF